jgi:acyl carrier protein
VPANSTEADQPYGAVEQAIATLWKEALDLPDSPSAGDNFFALGGDSTAMVMVEMRIQEKFSVDLPPGTLLNVASLRDLACLIEKARHHT